MLRMSETLHICNARIWTGDPGCPWAVSLTVRDGRIAALDEPIAAAGPGRTIDAGGRAVIPGLIDAHTHLILAGRALDRLDLSEITTRRDFEAVIARRHAELPADQWLIAGGWTDGHFPADEKPHVQWLAAAGDRPVVCYSMDLHSVLVNDAVLNRCDLSEDPPGGRIVRDHATGEPTGLLLEAAAWELVNPIVPKPDRQTARTQVLAAQAHAHRLGLTAVGSMEYGADLAEVFEPIRDQLTLRCRISLLDRELPIDFTYGRSFRNDDRLAVIGYKTFVDGAFGSRTARMLDDYADDEGNRGLYVELARDGHLLEWAQVVAAEGFSPTMHAIGDEAIRLVLDVIERIPSEVRPRIEHAQHIQPSDVHRFAGRIASMQPLHKADDGQYAEARLGSRRMAGTFAFRTLLDAGARLAFGSDWPVVSCDPLAGMRTAVTGLTFAGEIFLPEQNLTVEEALTAYTRGSAYALQLDNAGAIRPGALGDVVMLDRDPFTADWAHEPPRVVMTVVGGRVVYDIRDG
ncbi:MAG: amidohydrolase [Phycisphaerales bacterium]|nr:MAG: amidohydrolase [Phycisphaerales bacterium]